MTEVKKQYGVFSYWSYSRFARDMEAGPFEFPEDAKRFIRKELGGAFDFWEVHEVSTGYDPREGV